MTRLLHDSFGGSSQSLLICTLSPDPALVTATSSTLSFAMKSKRIVNHPVAHITTTTTLTSAHQSNSHKRRSLEEGEEDKSSTNSSSASLPPTHPTAKRFKSENSLER